MEFEKILQLIDKVSESNLTAFSYEEGNLKISLAADRQVVVSECCKDENKENSECNENKVLEKEGSNIKSPLVGTFYAAPNENAEPYISVGDVVKKGQIIGVVEAMKLMNEIESEFDGVVEKIYVENEQVVEYGQVLVKIV